MTRHYSSIAKLQSLLTTFFFFPLETEESHVAVSLSYFLICVWFVHSVLQRDGE